MRGARGMRTRFQTVEQAQLFLEANSDRMICIFGTFGFININ